MLHELNWWWAEFLGTFVLVFILNTGIAAEHLDGSNGTKAGRPVLVWSLIACVSVPVSMFGMVSGMFNPGVTLGKFVAGIVPAWKVLPDMSAQMLGAILAGVFQLIFHWQQFEATENSHTVLAAFATGPKIRNYFWNCLSEGMGSFFLVFIVLCIEKWYAAPGTVHGVVDLMVLSLVLGIMVAALAMSGGQTSPALNAARDLGPRLVHWLLPVPNKGTSDWAYGWVAPVGNLLGGAAAGLVFTLFVVHCF